MNKFVKVLDMTILTTFALLVLSFVIKTFSLISTDISKTFDACVTVALGVLIIIRWFPKVKPFFLPRKAPWPFPLFIFIPSTMFICKGMDNLVGPSIVTSLVQVLLFPTCVFIIMKMQKQR